MSSRQHTPGRPRLAYWREGEQGPRVLLIMGFGMRGEVWRPQVDRLRAAHRVAFYDNRGLGESDRAVATTMRCQASDAARVLDALGWAQAHVVGVSMGGMVAQEFALRHPGRLASLSLIATHAGGPRAVVPTRRGLSLFAKANVSPRDRRVEALRALLYPPAYAESAGAALDARLEAQFATPAPRATQGAQLASVLRHNTAGRLSRLSLPTLVIQPLEDILIRPDSCARLAQLIPGAELLPIPGAGHGVIYQCADQVAAAIGAHVARAATALEGAA